jgi:hypothetical protein
MTTQPEIATERDKKHFEVPVIYNGETKRIKADEDEQTDALLERAIREFHVTNQPHLLSLFREDGTRVEANQTLKQAHITPRTTLQLRPDAVKGGRAWC